MSGMEQKSALTQKQEQRQHLSQQQRRSLELLHLPVTALEERIAHDFLTNPVLEEAPPEEDPVPQENYDDPDDPETDESLLDARNAEADEWAESLPLPAESGSERAGNDLLSNSPAPGPSLRELLLTEIGASDLPQEKLLPVLEIVSALDDNGYLRSNLADLAMICDVSLPEMEEALYFVQRLAPPGVGARDLPECLALQLRAADQWDGQMEKLLSLCWDDLEKEQFSRVAEKLSVSREELDQLLARLRTLDRAPGRKFSPRRENLVRPDLEIRKTPAGKWEVIPQRERFPRIILSPLYEKMAENGSLTAEELRYLTEKIRSARDLVSALDRRDSTLTGLGRFIVEQQPEFWEHGRTEALKPLTMKAAGMALGVAESTISRAVEDKFVRTPYGVRPLRFFFPKGYADESAGISQQAVLEKIRRLIDGENPADPLSDDRIAEILKRESRISVARRTVAKYREMLQIPSSSRRKAGSVGRPD